MSSTRLTRVFHLVQGREMPVMSLDAQLEQILQSALQGTGGVLEPTLLESTVRQIAESAERFAAEGNTPVLLVSGNIRLFLARLLRSRIENLYVLAYEELPANKTIRVLETIGGSQGQLAHG